MAIKDSQFSSASPIISGTETVPILQGDPLDNALFPLPDILFRKVNDLGSVSGDISIDLSLGQVFTMQLTGNITSITFSNFPPSGYIMDRELRITQDTTGGWTITWPTGGSWPGAAPYVVSTTGTDHIGFAFNSDGTYTGYPVENIG